jgi:hypothetical protein
VDDAFSWSKISGTDASWQVDLVRIA